MKRRCKACGGEFPATAEFFVTIKKKMRNGTLWSGLASECRSCRNKRYGPYYRQHRDTIIARATASTRKRRERPEVREQERIASRDRKRTTLADPVKRAEHNVRGALWRKSNPDRAKLFKHEQPAMKRMRAARRYAAELNAMPPWADQGRIAALYEDAAFLTELFGEEYEVDHIYPLIHPNCCGLHVPWNLRVIPAEANRAKGNRLPE